VADPVGASFTAVDDGSGMRRRELARYHDVAASTKARGDGIGFAGVGIKLGLLVCEEVVTETRRGNTHVASGWRLASRHRAPWHWVPPPGLVSERGTAVRLQLRNALSPPPRLAANASHQPSDGSCASRRLFRKNGAASP